MNAETRERIPEARLEAIRNALPIEEAIGREVKLTGRPGKQVGLCPFHSESTGSFHVYGAKGFHCFGCGANGGDVIEWMAMRHKLKFRDAVRRCEAEAGLSGDVLPVSLASAPAKRAEPAAPDDTWLPELPVPADAPPPPDRHFKYGVPEHVATVRNAAGEVLQFIYRMPPAAEGERKQIWPLTFGTLTRKGKAPVRGWHWKAPPAPRPLYGLDLLADHPDRLVVVVEGEKKCDAARRLLGDRAVAISWPNGAQGIGAAGWEALRGRDVVMWPDRDAPGAAAASSVVNVLRGIAGSVRALTPPDGPTDGWDLGDAEAEGWTSERVLEHIQGPASPPAAVAEDAGAARDRSGPRRVLRMMVEHIRAGATFDQSRASLLKDPESADWVWKRGSANGNRELLRLWDRALARQSGGGANRPSIRIRPNSLTETADQAEAALIAADLGIYQRGEFIVRTGTVRIKASDDRSVMAQRILPMGEAALTEAMDRAANWAKWDARENDWLPADASPKVVKVYAERIGQWRLPVLAGIVNAPTLRPDGSVLAQPGYDAKTCLLFDPQGVTFPAIPDHPTQAQADAALQLLDDLIAGFDFVTPADRSVALSAMLTACVRRSLPTAPLHGYTAPTAGSGKTKLAELCSFLATGREAGVIAQGASEEETEKRLGSMLLAGDAVILIDNCTEPVAGDFICQMLSQPTVRTRILGVSKTPELPSDSLILATGNNLVIGGDMTRRTILCRLDPQCERPELRSFTSDPIETMRAHRGRYVSAALTVLRAYHVAGRPTKVTPLGSFEAWSRWVREPLLWLDRADPVETMESIRSEDPKLKDLVAVMEQWGEVIKEDAAVKTRDIIERATRQQTDSFGRHTFVAPDFREALLAVAGVGGAINGQRLGIWLNAHKDRIADGRRIIQSGTSAKTADWKLIKA